MNTRDLTEFGWRELGMARDLLDALTDNTPDSLGDGIAIKFNLSSGEVFLVDEDYNIAMGVDWELIQECSCSNCGVEGLAGDGDFNHDAYLCDDCYKEENPDEFEEDEAEEDTEE